MPKQTPKGVGYFALTKRAPSLTKGGAALLPPPLYRDFPFPVPLWRNGRRGRLKICCPHGRAGSSPARGTRPRFATAERSLPRRGLKGEAGLLAASYALASWALSFRPCTENE